MDRETVIIVNGDGMGRAEPALTHKLLATYLGVLETSGPISVPSALGAPIWIWET